MIAVTDGRAAKGHVGVICGGGSAAPSPHVGYRTSTIFTIRERARLRAAQDSR